MMALSIKTEEADRLARELAAITGENMTLAVTTALRERIERLKSPQGRKPGILADRLMQVAAEIREEYDLKAVSKAEWDALWGDTDDVTGTASQK